jgi:16S rRNA (cytidine1402-2'-O)-methyltransferase
MSERAGVFYESPHRIMKALESLQKFLNAPSLANATEGKTGRRVGIYRELTKLHEEHVVGSIDAVIEHFTTNPDRIRGEFVVIVEERK